MSRLNARTLAIALTVAMLAALWGMALAAERTVLIDDHDAAFVYKGYG